MLSRRECIYEHTIEQTAHSHRKGLAIFSGHRPRRHGNGDFVKGVFAWDRGLDLAMVQAQQASACQIAPCRRWWRRWASDGPVRPALSSGARGSSTRALQRPGGAPLLRASATALRSVAESGVADVLRFRFAGGLAPSAPIVAQGSSRWRRWATRGLLQGAFWLVAGAIRGDGLAESAVASRGAARAPRRSGAFPVCAAAHRGARCPAALASSTVRRSGRAERLRPSALRFDVCAFRAAELAI